MTTWGTPGKNIIRRMIKTHTQKKSSISRAFLIDRLELR